MPPELLSLISARNGHFRLESGHHGNLWLELDPLFLRPSRLMPFVRELATRLAPYNIDAVCGPLTGGAFLAQALASTMEIEFYHTERLVSTEREGLYPVQYRIPRGLRKTARGKKIAIVDDVINAGSAVRGTLAEVQVYGANPVAIGALLVLGSTAASFFAEQNIPVECLAHLPSGIWAPSECPLCAAQTPLEDLTTQ